MLYIIYYAKSIKNIKMCLSSLFMIWFEYAPTEISWQSEDDSWEKSLSNQSDVL